MISRRLALVPALGLTLLSSGCLLLPINLRAEREAAPEGVELSAAAARTLRELGDTAICEVDANPAPPPAIVLSSDLIRTIVAGLKPAVVNLYVESSTPVRVNVLGLPVPGLPSVGIPGEALGSGFFCSDRGFILTNAHVVRRAARLRAKTSDGELHALEVVAVDRRADLALLRATDGESHPTTTLGASERLAEGDWVIAIGNPLGLNHTVSHGIVSQRSRALGEARDGEEEPTFLQSDTPINPGSSGGPLIDLTGRVVGINTAIARGAQGISFTTPSERIVRFLADVRRAALGAAPRNSSSAP